MSTSSSTVREAKHALRQSIRSKLPAASTEAIAQQSITAQTLILNMPAYTSAKRIGIYLSMPVGEASTELLVRDALSLGKAVFVPYLHRLKASDRKREMHMLALRDLDEYEGLERDRWGIPSLSGGSVGGRGNAMGGVGVLGSEVESKEGSGGLDVIVVPGVAFDAKGGRLGHGAGFYDEFLARYCGAGERQKPYLVGLCLAEQFVGTDAEIPTTELDWSVHAVAVGDGRLVTCNEAS